MPDDNFDDVVEDLELLAEESCLSGDTPDNAGIECRFCGISFGVPWIQRAELPERMRTHLEVCPVGPGDPMDNPQQKEPS